jgi:hypothetical protein
MHLTRFSKGSANYTFPDSLQGYSDNFKNVVAQTVRGPGLSGGLDQYGLGVAPSEIGRITQSLILQDDDREGMDDLRIALSLMASWGMGVLWAQPTDPADAERFCLARINSIQVPERQEGHTDLFQPVTVIWQAADPFWFGKGTEALPDLADYSPTGWPGTAQSDACSGTSTTLTTITNAGNARALPRFTITTGAAQTALNVTIQRVDGSTVLDQVAFQGELRNNDTLVIDCQQVLVAVGTNSDVNAYRRLTALHPDWMRLQPGDNTLKVLLEQAGDACTVSTRWYDVYR